MEFTRLQLIYKEKKVMDILQLKNTTEIKTSIDVFNGIQEKSVNWKRIKNIKPTEIKKNRTNGCKGHVRHSEKISSILVTGGPGREERITQKQYLLISI